MNTNSAPRTPQDVMAALSTRQRLPEAALGAATAQRAAVAPLLIEEFEVFLSASPAHRARDGARQDLLFLAFHLLGEWQEQSAYRTLARFLRQPRQDIEPVLGDAITTTTHRVMAAVQDGDPQPLFDIILDPAAEEFVRAAMCETLAMASARGAVARESVVRFLRDAFNDLEPQAACYVWSGWQSAIAMLGLSELEGLVDEAFRRGFIDPTWMKFRHFKNELDDVLANPEAPHWTRRSHYTLFGNTVEELSTWHSFSAASDAAPATALPAFRPAGSEADPAINPWRRLGRNDPCPCGSGLSSRNAAYRSFRRAPDCSYSCRSLMSKGCGTRARRHLPLRPWLWRLLLRVVLRPHGAGVGTLSVDPAGDATVLTTRDETVEHVDVVDEVVRSEAQDVEQLNEKLARQGITAGDLVAGGSYTWISGPLVSPDMRHPAAGRSRATSTMSSCPSSGGSRPPSSLPRSSPERRNRHPRRGQQDDLA